MSYLAYHSSRFLCSTQSLYAVLRTLTFCILYAKSKGFFPLFSLILEGGMQKRSVDLPLHTMTHHKKRGFSTQFSTQSTGYSVLVTTSVTTVTTHPSDSNSLALSQITHRLIPSKGHSRFTFINLLHLLFGFYRIYSLFIVYFYKTLFNCFVTKQFAHIHIKANATS